MAENGVSRYVKADAQSRAAWIQAKGAKQDNKALTQFIGQVLPTPPCRTKIQENASIFFNLKDLRIKIVGGSPAVGRAQ